MDQYYKLIGSCRVPNSQKDLVKVKQVYLSDFENMRHITVIFKNRVNNFVSANDDYNLFLNFFKLWA